MGGSHSRILSVLGLPPPVIRAKVVLELPQRLGRSLATGVLPYEGTSDGVVEQVNLSWSDLQDLAHALHVRLSNVLHRHASLELILITGEGSNGLLHDLVLEVLETPPPRYGLPYGILNPGVSVLHSHAVGIGVEIPLLLSRLIPSHTA